LPSIQTRNTGTAGCGARARTAALDAASPLQDGYALLKRELDAAPNCHAAFFTSKISAAARGTQVEEVSDGRD